MDTFSEPKMKDAVAAALHERCHALGLPVWHCDPDGRVVTKPEPFGATDVFLHSQTVHTDIEDAARTILAQRDPGLLEIATGCTLIPVIRSHRVRRVGVHIVMVLTPEALGGSWFNQACASTGLSVSDTQAAMRVELTGLDGTAAHDVKQLQTVLAWSFNDLTQTLEDRRSIEQFSEKLMQSYEEVNLLYRLSASMKCLPDPRQMMRVTCDQLLDVLPFEWVAAVFSDDPAVVADLAGRVVCSGQPPVGRGAFDGMLHAMLRKQGNDTGRDITLLRDGALARASESEVVITPIEHAGRIIATLAAGGKRGVGGEEEVCSAETKMLRASADFLGVFIENATAFHEQKTLFLGTLQALTATIDAKDEYTCGHSERVALLAKQVALTVGLTEDEAHKAHVAGLMHDVGKIGIPERVLGKAGRLTDDEFEQIKRHPVIGYHILKDIPPLRDMLDGVLYHHERYDGRGYPEGLAGKRIPLLGRLIAVCDVFDAMSSTRAYRSAMPREQVIHEIKRSAGTQLDPDMVAAFLKVDLAEYDHSLQRHSVLDQRAA